MEEDKAHTQESLVQKIVLDKVEKAFELIDKVADAAALDNIRREGYEIEEILEQINLLKGYAEDSGRFIKHVDEFSRFMKQEQLDYLDDEYRPKTKRFCENLIDVWIAEFLR